MKCKYCNADVSAAETICPKCHHSVKEDNPETLKKKKRNRYIAIGVGLIAVIFIVSTVGITLRSQQNLTAQAGQAVSHQGTASAAAELNLPYSKLRDAFNDNAMAKKENLSLKDISKTTPDFQYNLANKILLSGKINTQNQHIISLQMIAQPSSQEEMVQMVTAIGVFIESFYPSDAASMRKKVLDDLGFKKGADIRTANNDSLQKDIKFHFSFVKDTGYVFIAEPAN